MDPFPFPSSQQPRPAPTNGLGVGFVCEVFMPKLDTGLEGPPQRERALSDANIPDNVVRKSNELSPHYDDPKRMMLVSNGPPSPIYEEEYLPNSPTFFVDAYSKIRNLSGELFQCAGDTLARGYATDPSKIEYLAQELHKVARQLNNSADDDDRKRLPPPLVRPRRIRRKHNEEEECEDGDKVNIRATIMKAESGEKRKMGVAPELYCHSCGTTDTPEWRRGPDGCKSLCNACGLHYAKILRRETMIPNRQPARTTMTLNNLLNC